MLVDKWMTRNPVSIPENTTLEEAYRVLWEYEIRHLPVTSKEGRIVGLVSDHDIGRELLSAIEEQKQSAEQAGSNRFQSSKTTVADVMTRNVQTIHPDDTVAGAALLIHNRKIGCLPVLDDRNELVGILTTNDLLEILVSLLPDPLDG